MNSGKVCPFNEKIDYENIPTLRNDQKQQNNKRNNTKENKVNPKFIYSMRMPINPISSRSKKFQKNLVEVKDIKLNKISRNNNIKEFKIMKNINNKSNNKHNKNKSVINNTHLIQRNTNKIQNIVSPINKINKSTTIKQSSKQNKKIIQKEEDSPNKGSKYCQNKNNDIQNPQERILLTEINLLTKEIPLLSSSSNKKNKNCNKSQIVPKANNVSFISGLSCCKSMAEIESNINDLYKWEKRRREKIEKMRNLQDKQLKKYAYKPKICKRSNSLAMKLKLKYDKNGNIFERLYKEDPIIKEKKKILKDLFTPSFKPQINSSNKKKYRNMNHSSVKKKENKNEYLIKVNRIKFIKKNEKNNLILDEEEKMDEDDIMQNILRKTILNNINNKFKSNSAAKRNNKILFL